MHKGISKDLKLRKFKALIINRLTHFLNKKNNYILYSDFLTRAKIANIFNFARVLFREQRKRQNLARTKISQIMNLSCLILT